MAVAVAPAAVTAQTLVALWHGDQDAAGYAHMEIIVALCDTLGLNPAGSITSWSKVRDTLYPPRLVGSGYPPKTEPVELEEWAERMIKDGYELWKRRRARR